ncbi:MAG: serine/threonine protein kinase [Verrucomicrobiales bacterium]|nr:serine/threonine protein kinase [Verrucomicrobiales bacterium]
MNACPTCGGIIDVSACSPYSKVLCPKCRTAIRVRAEFLQFKIEEKIGIGGMSRVFRAIDQTLDRQVALKILNANFSKDAKRAKEFEREAKITAVISHPNVVKVYSAGRDQDHYFIAMELVGGGSLDERIQAEGRLPESRVLEIALEITQGLSAAHEAGMIHRDIKPGNILLSEDETSKIVDFGLARILEGVDRDEGEIWATPYYVPPEKLHLQEEDFRSDIYSLGATLFHALAGQPPYSADTASIDELKAIKDKAISLEMFSPDVSVTTCGLIDRMMEREPDDRYSSYEELIEHLSFARKKVLEGGSGSKALKGQRMRHRVYERNARTAALVVFVIVVIALGIKLGFYFKSTDADEVVAVKPDESGSVVLDKGVKSTTERFRDARQMLIERNFKAAESAFKEIADSGTTIQPTANWALFNQGLSLLLQGKLVAARSIFKKLELQGNFSEEESSRSLCRFFCRAGELLGSELPVLPEYRNDFSEEDFSGEKTETLIFLACGLKNWEMGAFVAAQGYFRTFRDLSSSGDLNLVNEFRGLLAPYLHDLDKLQLFPPFVRDSSYEESLAALEKSKKLYGGLKMQGVQKRMRKRIDRLEQSVNMLRLEYRKAEAEKVIKLKAQESQRIAVLLATIAPFRKNRQFGMGIKMLEEESFEHPALKQRHADELYIWRASEKFIDRLIADLNKFGYTGPVTESRSLNIVAADELHLTHRFGAQGEGKIPFDQLTGRALLVMAEKLSQNYLPGSGEHLSRQESMALFAYMIADWDVAKSAGEKIEGKFFQELWSRISAPERRN